MFETLDESGKCLEIVFLRQRRGGPGLRRGTFDHDVLVVVLTTMASHVEARAPKQSTQRTEAEVAAVLEVDVPENEISQTFLHVGHPKQNDGVMTVADGRTHSLDEVLGRRDVPEGHPATDEVSVPIGVFGAVEITDELQLGVASSIPTRVVRRVEPEAPVVSRLAQHSQELSAPAADFDDAFFAQPVAFDELVGKLLVPLSENARAAFSVLVEVSSTSRRAPVRRDVHPGIWTRRREL